jgi:anti-sigma factor RsiW
VNEDTSVNDVHLNDRELVMALDGELPAKDAKRVRSHLEACWTCRARQRELEQAVSNFVQFHKQSEPAPFPSAAGPRALLKARIGEMSGQKTSPLLALRRWQPPPGSHYAWIGGMIAAVLLVAIVADRMFIERPAPAVVFAAPNPSLTPGAAVFEAPQQLCHELLPKNKAVSSNLKRRVLAEYGVANAPEQAYEVDYLITPALGGSDDIHNLWPHSYAHTEWNASVKDQLEDRLRVMVCQGQLELPTAQREIATNWIEAYKKYFHTDRPLRAEHAFDAN